jgi:hypothetical protein
LSDRRCGNRGRRQARSGRLQKFSSFHADPPSRVSSLVLIFLWWHRSFARRSKVFAKDEQRHIRRRTWRCPANEFNTYKLEAEKRIPRSLRHYIW